MALTLVTRELFSGYGTLDSGTPGNLGTVWAGEFRKRPLGPNVSGMATDPNYGWSALLRGVGYSHAHYRTLTTPEKTCGVWSCWYHVSHVIGVDGGPILALLRSDLTSGTEPLSGIQIATSGQLARYGVYGVNATNTTALPIVPLHAWFMLCCAWEDDGTYTDVNWYWCCPDAGVAPLTLISSQQHNIFTLKAARIDSGSFALVGSNAQNAITGRYALPTYYSAAAIEDATTVNLAAELPVKRRTVYRVRPGDAAANDASDGIAAAGRCWSTLARVKTAFKEGELLGSSVRWYDTAAGSTFDTSATSQQAAIDFADGIAAGTIVPDPNHGSTVNFDSDLDYIYDDQSAWKVSFGRVLQHGIRFSSSIAIGLQKGVRPSVPLTNTWTQPDAGTYPNLWQVTLPSSFTSCGLWEITADGTVLATQQIASSSWDSTAQAAVNSVAGRFWFSGTALYYHPLSGANPNTDNRSRRATNNATDTTIVFENWGGMVDNIKTTQTGAGVWNGSSSAVFALGGYGVTAQGNYSAIKGVVAERYGKHGFGDFVGNGSSAWVDIETRGAIITSILSLTPHVIYRINGETTGTVVMQDWTETGRYEVLGSSSYVTTIDANWNSLLAHNDGVGGSLEAVVLTSCDILGTILLTNMPSKATVLLNTDSSVVTAPQLMDLGEYIPASQGGGDAASIAAATLAAFKADADFGTSGLLADADAAKTSAATAATEVAKVPRAASALTAGGFRWTKDSATASLLDVTISETP